MYIYLQSSTWIVLSCRSTGSHAITFGTSTRRESSLTTLAMKSSIADESDVDYRGGSSSTIGQEDPMPIFLRRLNDLNVRVGTRTRLLIELDDATGVQVQANYMMLETRFSYFFWTKLRKPNVKRGTKKSACRPVNIKRKKNKLFLNSIRWTNSKRV